MSKRRVFWLYCGALAILGVLGGAGVIWDGELISSTPMHRGWPYDGGWFSYGLILVLVFGVASVICFWRAFRCPD